MATNVSFDTNSLQTANILSDDIDHAGMPMKDIKMLSIAHANHSAIPFVNYPTKTIPITGVVTDTSIPNLDSRLDTFRSYFLGQDRNLDIDYNGSTRRYIATLDASNSTISRPGGLLVAPYSLKFLCSLPWGFDTSATTILTASGRTSNAYGDAETFGGTAPWQLPIITITLTATPGTPAGYIFYGNGGNGQGIFVNRTWANADVLVIDCTQKTVTVNGVQTNFIGAFPEFPPGAQTLQYSDSFSSRTFSITVTYTKAYL